MAFKRKVAVVEAVDLNAVTPQDAERRITLGVKKYATHEANWAKADANTPYLGHIIGMGIESSNLADITMSIERQFLTKKTRRVPLAEGSGDFKLEDGELGPLRILDGQDSLAATPGLSVKMLMDLGHMPADQGYLDGVVSYAYVVAVGEGYRLAENVAKTASRAAKLSGAEQGEAMANLKSLLGQAESYRAEITDKAAFAASRRQKLAADDSAYKALKDEWDLVSQKLKAATSGSDQERLAQLRTEEAEVKTRLKMMAQKLRVSSEVAAGAARRSAAEEAKVSEVLKALAQAAAAAQAPV